MRPICKDHEWQTWVGAHKKSHVFSAIAKQFTDTCFELLVPQVLPIRRLVYDLLQKNIATRKENYQTLIS